MVVAAAASNSMQQQQAASNNNKQLAITATAARQLRRQLGNQLMLTPSVAVLKTENKSINHQQSTATPCNSNTVQQSTPCNSQQSTATPCNSQQQHRENIVTESVSKNRLVGSIQKAPKKETFGCTYLQYTWEGGKNNTGCVLM